MLTITVLVLFQVNNINVQHRFNLLSLIITLTNRISVSNGSRHLIQMNHMPKILYIKQILALISHVFATLVIG